MKKIVFTIAFIMLHYFIGIGLDYLVGQGVSLPAKLLGVMLLAVWGGVNYKLYSSDDSALDHMLHIGIPTAILLLAYIPLVRILIINLPLIYVAPIFVSATSIAACFTLPITVWTVVGIAILLLIGIAYFAVLMKQKTFAKKNE